VQEDFLLGYILPKRAVKPLALAVGIYGAPQGALINKTTGCYKELTGLKKELPWLKEVDSMALQ